MAEFLAPGVYIEEIPAGVHPISGVPTSTAAFVGATASGPTMRLCWCTASRNFKRSSAVWPPTCRSATPCSSIRERRREALIARVVPSGATLSDADLSSPTLEQPAPRPVAARSGRVIQYPLHSAALAAPPTSGAPRGRGDRLRHAPRRHRARRSVRAWTGAQAVSETAITAVASRSPNAALYYPRLQASDPLHGNQLASFAPCGAIAACMPASTPRAVLWKAPAGSEATSPASRD